MSQTLAARTLDRLGRWIARRHWIVLIIGAAVAIPATWCAFSLRPEGNLAAMLALNQPSTDSLARLMDRFRSTEELLVLATAPATMPSNDLPEPLYEFARRLRDTIEQTPDLKSMVARVRFEPSGDMRRFVQEVLVPNLAYYLSSQAWDRFKDRLSPEHIRERVARLDSLVAAPAAAGGALLKAAMKDPLGIYEFAVELMPSMGQPAVGAPSGSPFLSPDGQHLLIRIQGTRPVADLEFAVRLTDLVGSVAEHVNSDRLQLRFTGAYAIAATSQRSIRNDMIFTITASLIALQLLFWISYRELWTFPFAIAPVALGIIFAFATAKLIGIPLTPMTAVIGGILAGLGIDYSIHPLSRYRYERTLTDDRPLAIGRTLADTVPPNAAALITTASGFVALSATSVQMVRGFGIISSLGLCGCFISCLFFFPAIVAALPVRSRTFRSRQPTATRLIHWIVAHRGLALTASITLAAVAAASVLLRPTTLIEGDLSVLHPRPNPALTAQRELTKIFGAANEPWVIHLEAPNDDALLRLAHDVQRRLSTLDSLDSCVVGAIGLASLLPDPSAIEARRQALSSLDAEGIVREFHDALEQSQLNPEGFAGYEEFIRKVLTAANPPTIDVLRAYDEVASLTLPSVAGPRDRSEAITVVFLSKVMDDRAARDHTITVIRNALTLSPLPSRAEPGLADVTGRSGGASPVTPDSSATLTGLSVVAYDLEEQIKQDLARSMWLADVLVVACLFLYFRSIKYVLLAAIPPAFAALMLYAGMQLLDIRLNLVNLVGLPLLVGIGVDNGVFLTSLIMDKSDPQPLIDRMGAAVHAITMTTLTTVLTFGALLLTSTPAIRSLGVLMAVGVTSALIGALCLLCPLLCRAATVRERPDSS